MGVFDREFSSIRRKRLTGPFKITGIMEMAEQLGFLGTRLEREISKEALEAGADEILKEVRARTPVETGTLKESIGVEIKPQAAGSLFVQAEIGPRPGFKRFTDQGFRNPQRYAHLVEFGTSTTAAQSFMRAGFMAGKGAAIRAMRDAVQYGIVRELRKSKAA